MSLRVCCRILSRLMMRMDLGTVMRYLLWPTYKWLEGSECAEGFSRGWSSIVGCISINFNSELLMLSVSFCTPHQVRLHPADQAYNEITTEDSLRLTYVDCLPLQE